LQRDTSLSSAHPLIYILFYFQILFYETIHQVLDSFEKTVLPLANTLPTSVIMGDFNGNVSTHDTHSHTYIYICICVCNKPVNHSINLALLSQPNIYIYIYSKTDANIIVGKKGDSYEVVGMIDVGDMVHTWRVCEVCVCVRVRGVFQLVVVVAASL
jgi:hypothetical protein